MFRSNVKLVGLLIVLSGCAQHPDTLSVVHKQAMERGNTALSRQYYDDALQINTRIENARGIAANTLSLAQIYLGSGEYDLAGEKLSVILEDKNHLFTASERADAAARSALLALLLKQPARAAEWAQQAQLLCNEANCSSLAAILNLRAQAAFALGRIQESDDLARQAGVVAEKSQQLAEQANSFRLQGEMQLRQKLHSAAIPLLEHALLLDKQLGQAGKIAEDLHLLAEAKDMLGQRDEAASYRNRERAIRLALGEKLL
jgi:tetratricopeptide (TPR) repeat protein